MPLWEIALAALVAAWSLQAIGVWKQANNYARTLGAMRTQWRDGALGAGAAPGRFGPGAIAMVVADPAGIVRDVRMMRGRSVFATFERRTDCEGISLAALKARAAGLDRRGGRAIAQAVEQIERLKARANGAGAAGT
ncbi:MAG: transcriptional regulator [Hyphomicrobiales bacterium]|nr:transcriptional regulator [Hyphomicrobiales bacterium]MDE2018119.1 transcriptional regulator [Hyphomicrobiales bacterium]